MIAKVITDAVITLRAKGVLLVMPRPQTNGLSWENLSCGHPKTLPADEQLGGEEKQGPRVGRGIRGGDVKVRSWKLSLLRLSGISCNNS